MRSLALILVLIGVASAYDLGRIRRSLGFGRECVTVKGNFTCGGNVARIKMVKVVLEDHGYLDSKVVDTGYSANSGLFIVHGCSDSLKPQLKVYHECPSGQAYEWIHKVGGSWEGREYDMGNIDLLRPHGEKERFTTQKAYTGNMDPPCYT